MTAYAYFHSPIGFIELRSDGRALASARFVEAPTQAHLPDFILQRTIRQLTGYFSGELTAFDLPLRLRGSDFQRSVWRVVMQIPFGETRTYGEIANVLGNPRSARAVGAAVGANPLLIIVPCHRVIASGGKIGGYAGGLWRKAWLLRHEKELTY